MGKLLYLLIVNKNGSLIYDRPFGQSKLASNEFINIASIFYSMHAISAKLTPPCQEKQTELKLENNGIELIEATSINLVCFQTLTKLKFIFVTDKNETMPQCKENFKKIYNAYSDIVSKNPFYELDQPIRIDAFDAEITRILG